MNLPTDLQTYQPTNGGTSPLQTWKKTIFCELQIFVSKDLAEKTRNLRQILNCDETA